eukprot:TRINITY_DN24841_c0_g1_i1.p1 TRINITY_DN24841_c0_g1~~TRINITY_DN24841_c0_g1_i1.p1  ORF type:complete len:349 (+),score=64.32 TRINITY_DN24841_c0_g1_i1:61-1107(+)
MRLVRKKICIETAVRDFELLVAEVSLPTLDRLMYRNNIVGTDNCLAKIEENATKLQKLIDILRDHKLRTMKVLVAIQNREAVLSTIMDLLPSFDTLSDTLETTSDDNQTDITLRTKALRYFYLLQSTTRDVVEAVKYWRQILTRPFAFVFNHQNYLIKIARDCRVIERSKLTNYLPLKLCSHPLCSNVPSLGLFQCSEQTGISGKLPQASSPVYLRKLKKLEEYVAAEFATQSSLLHELIGLCVNGYFVPLLNTSLVPNGSVGVPINSQRWALRQAGALRKLYENLTKQPDDDYGMEPVLNSDDINNNNSNITPSSEGSAESEQSITQKSPEALDNDLDNDMLANTSL